MCKNLFSGRELIWRPIVRDIQVRYRQSLLGYAWTVLPASATVAIFSFLKVAGTVPLRNTPIPCAAYALWGISLCSFFPVVLRARLEA